MPLGREGRCPAQQLARCQPAAESFKPDHPIDLHEIICDKYDRGGLVYGGHIVESAFRLLFRLLLRPPGGGGGEVVKSAPASESDFWLLPQPPPTVSNQCETMGTLTHWSFHLLAQLCFFASSDRLLHPGFDLLHRVI